MVAEPVRGVNNNRDIRAARPTTVSPQPNATPQLTRKAASSKTRKWWPLIGGVILVAAIAVAIGLHYRQQGFGQVINTSRYQAVTLGNGQVYFGKLANVNDKYMKITDVYYFQSKDGTPAKSTSGSATATGDNPTLVKHGTEVQNPEDEIVLSKSDIVSWENLKDSGKVVDAIKNYKAQRGQ